MATPIKQLNMSNRSTGFILRGVRFDDPEINKLTNKFERRLLGKSGAFTRGVARRSIRFAVKATTHSVPGQPPVAHNRIFRSSINFSYDPVTRSVVVGPERFKTTSLNSRGQTVPEILEVGGNAAAGKNQHWPVSYPKNNNTIYQMLTQKEFCIVRWGLSAADLIRRSRKAGDYKSLLKRGKRGAYRTPGFFSPNKGRLVYLQFAKLKKPAQLQKTRDILIKLFGLPWISNNKIAPRPFITPAFNIMRQNLPELMRQAEVK